MKKSHLTVIAAFMLQGCATHHGHTPTQMASNFINNQSVTTTTPERYPAKNPQVVSLYNDTKTPHTAYRVIGIAKVAKHNMLGVARPETEITNRMKSLAASIGGDGLINIDTNRDATQAHVIAFQKILI